MIYLAALLAELAGVEAIIGAFLAGLALNRLIPHNSSLMNRVEFVGNAIFIPFFLISVGMLIDFKAFISSWETLGVAAIMLVASIGGKYISAVISQKTFRFSKNEGMLIFGLSSASAAATLATVMVGYNIILSENELGEPVRLLNEHVLNGSILLILISCTISSFVTMSSAEKIILTDNEDAVTGVNHEQENILLAINYEKMVDKMVNLGLLLKNHSNTENIFALNVINEDKKESSVKNAEKILNSAVNTASGADVTLTPLTRYDNDVINGIRNVVKEQKITDLIIGLENERGFSASFADNLYNGYLQNDDINILVYHAEQPISTVKRYLVMIPENAHLEAGFYHALARIWNIGKNSGAMMSFFAPENIINVLQKIIKKVNIEADFTIANTWAETEKKAENIDDNEGLILILAKRGMPSYFPKMRYVPDFLNRHLQHNNYLLIYPYTGTDESDAEIRSVRNHDDFVEIGNIIKNIFR